MYSSTSYTLSIIFGVRLDEHFLDWSQYEVDLLMKITADWVCKSTVIVPVSLHLHIAFVAPILSPAILQQPVVLSFFVSAIPDNQYEVIQLIRTAVLLLENSAFVINELSIVTIDRYGNWPDSRYGIQ